MNAPASTKRPIRAAVVCGIAAVALLGLSTGATANPLRSTAAKHTTETLRLIGHETDNAFLDQGPPGPSLGDEVVFGGTLERAAGNGPAGRFGGTLVSITPDDSLLQANLTLQLPEGQIAIQGVLDFSKPPYVHAITGGTGAYSGAEGEFTLNSQTQGVLDMTLTFER